MDMVEFLVKFHKNPENFFCFLKILDALQSGHQKYDFEKIQ